MSVAEILRGAADLVSVEERWTDTFARDASGGSVHWRDATAARWCLMGAICRVAHERDAIHWHREQALGYMLHEAYKLDLPGWKGLNDRGHEEVIVAFGRASRREAAKLPAPRLNEDRVFWMVSEELRVRKLVDVLRGGG